MDVGMSRITRRKSIKGLVRVVLISLLKRCARFDVLSK